jgi:hypothetical protein
MAKLQSNSATMSDSTAKLTDKMIELFLSKPESIRDEPALLELLQILNYLIDCSQTYETDLSPVNMMSVTLPVQPFGQYSQYSSTVYLQQATYLNPGAVPNCAGTNGATDQAITKAIFNSYPIMDVYIRPL